METITPEPGSKRLDVRDVPDLRISQTVGPLSFLDTTKSKLYCDATTLHKLSPSYSNCHRYICYVWDWLWFEFSLTKPRVVKTSLWDLHSVLPER
jgi:hypothetical protein